MSCELAKPDDSGASFGIFYRGNNGVCQEEEYETEDPVIKSARSALILSMICGFVAGTMVTFEWLLCEICCAGVLEGLAYLGAWVIGGATFMFYGSEICLEAEGGQCEYYDASTYMTVACICYFGCSVLLCLYVPLSCLFILVFVVVFYIL